MEKVSGKKGDWAAPAAGEVHLVETGWVVEATGDLRRPWAGGMRSHVPSKSPFQGWLRIYAVARVLVLGNPKSCVPK